MAEKEYALKTVNRAFELLRVIQNAPRPMRLSEIAEVAEMNTTNVFRLMKTLESSGHVQRDAQKEYSASKGGGADLSLADGLALLDHLAGVDEGGVANAEICELLGVDPPRASRALKHLESAGYVENLGGGWRISNAMVRFLRPILNDRFLERFIRPILKEINEQTGETVSWYVPKGWDQIVVEVRPSVHSLRYVLDTGARYPMYLGAAGKAHLAARPEAAVAAFLETLEPVHFTRFRLDRKRLLEDLRQTRARGFALSENERVEGATSVACAVHGPDGSEKGVISVMMPRFRISDDELAAIGTRLSGRIRTVYDFDGGKP